MSAAATMQQKNQTARRRLHTTVFCQCFSPCGKYLAACTNFGFISIFRVSTALSPEATEESWQPFFAFKAHDGPVYSLASTERLLISAGTGDIQAWNWTDVLSKSPKVVWNFSIPSVDRFANPETNSMIASNQDSTSQLFAGCGDNMVHSWDMESGRHLTSYRGHTDYVHSVTLKCGGKECVSGSEDGTVRIWDTRLPGEAVNIIEPYKNEDCARPELGRWISCVAVDKADDWLVCGGGPQLCMWHLRSLTPTTVFKTDTASNHVMFHEDTIISAGNEALVHHWSVNGDKRAQVPCTPTNVFNIAINDKSDNTKVLSTAGNSHKIDVCTNFGYKAFSLCLD